MSKKKIIILSIFLILIILISGCLIYNHFTTNQKYDYKFYDEIPKGYFDYDGETLAGKDYEHYYWYKYNEMPQLCSDYKLVGKDTEMIINALDPYSYGSLTSLGILSNAVTENDYYILRSYYPNGKELHLKNGYRNENYEIYYYDVESNTLQNVRIIW